jgi:GNAT superfamily N-acetyltransferase
MFDAGNLLLVKDGGKVVGIDFFEIDNGIVHHVTLGFLPEYRRQGIGDRFMPYTGAHYRSRGATQIILYFPVVDGQQQFYQRWNCRKIGQEVVGGKVFDVYVYHLIGPVRTKPVEK